MERFVIHCKTNQEAEELLQYLKSNRCTDSFGNYLKFEIRNLLYKENVGFDIARTSKEELIYIGYDSIIRFNKAIFKIISYYDFYNSYINTDAGDFEKSNYSVEYLLE